ncbi:hypothetical protein [Sinorhizobium meliloti]|uniref:hypothetical protein n=1 Tax=Rhizobium meliloti TaxID=382 RepID=UPI002090F061|nr:hypothetical protein [Sinorhizobium meliloti]MCO5965411.1 hypothetical protein [Sinorhizobium meliloti]
MNETVPSRQNCGKISLDGGSGFLGLERTASERSLERPLKTLAVIYPIGSVDLAAALTLLLLQNGFGLIERPDEDRLELLVAGDLALDAVSYRRPWAISVRFLAHRH